MDPVICRARTRGGWSVWLCFVLASYALLGACGPKTVTHSQTQAEGGNDDEERYGAMPRLADPPTIDLTAPAADYLIEVSELIQPAWASFLEDCRLRLPQSNALNDASLLATLEMTIDARGKMIAIETLHSSGNSDFDQVAHEILKDLSALPTPPPEWVSDDDRVHVRWKFARDIRQASSLGGSIRRVNLPVLEAMQRLLARGEIARASRRILDAGGRSVPVEQVSEVLNRALLLAISQDDPKLAAQALGVVERAALPGFIGPVREALDSSDSERSTAAARALGSIGDINDIPALASIARGEGTGSSELSAASGHSLRKLGQETQTLAAALEDLASPELARRLAALAVLSHLDAGSSVRALAKILKANKQISRAERVAASAALGRQAPKSGIALKALLAGTKSPDAAVRFGSLSAIAQAASAGMTSRLAYWRAVELTKNKDERVRAMAITAAARLDPRTFAKQLKSVRASGSQLVVLSIAGVLGDVPGELALDRLLDLAAAPSPAMRRLAALGLAKRSDDRAEVVLQRLVLDDSAEVRAAAVISLKHEPTLKILLQDPSPQVRVKALATLVALLGKSKTSKFFAAQIAASSGDRALQVELARAWHLGHL